MRLLFSVIPAFAASMTLACGPDPRVSDTSRETEALGKSDSALASDRSATEIDILPGTYPNQLGPADTMVPVAVKALARKRSAHGTRLRAEASSTFDAGAPIVVATAIDARHRGDDVLVTFSAADLRAAGLLGPGTTRLRVRLTASDGSTWIGEDRLFDRGAFAVTFPPPSGRHPVGTASSALFDPSRVGPTAGGRELLLRAWYPAVNDDTEPTTYFLSDREAELNAQAIGLPPNLFDAIHAFSAIGVRPAGAARLPALVMSTGLGSSLTFYSQIAEEMASHGYVVVGVEHPVGSGIVVYADGSVSAVDPSAFPPDELNRDWALDLELVARWLSNHASSRSDGTPASAALALVDGERIGAFGHSFGGSAALWAALDSPIVRASCNVDGRLWGDLLERAPTTPVLVMLSEGHTPDIDPTIGAFLGHAAGPWYTVQVAGSAHNDFSDIAVLARALATIDPTIDPANFAVGPIDAARAIAVESAYLRAFFDSSLRGRSSSLLDGPSSDFPEVSFTSHQIASAAQFAR